VAVEKIVERYTSQVGKVVLGATREQGGTRGNTVTVGGDTTMPFLHFEGEQPFRPVIALEVVDRSPEDWNEAVKKPFKDVLGDPAAWAQKCVSELGADLIYLRLQSAHPDLENSGPDQCANTVKKVLEAVDVPLIVVGCGDAEKDNLVMPTVAEAGAGENLLLGVATQENYKTLSAACMANKHCIIAQSPIDINICKQLNILISEMNVPLDRIVIDPTAAALGYGIEYVYSILERMRLGALSGDSMLAMPTIGIVGYEAWRSKEANAPQDQFPGWGDLEGRGILFESVTASALLQSGIHILVLRHPRSVEMVRRQVEELMVSNAF